MTADIRNQQRWLFTVVAILVIFLVLVIVGLIQSIPGRGSESESQVGHRSPAVELAYCRPEETRLCVVSFGQIEGGDMLVNFQLPSTIYPPFILVINRFGVESAYECRRTKGFLGGMTCSGISQVPGEILQFKVLALKDGRLIAEGKFPIIGIAISTPEDLSTPTETAIGSATASPTEPFPTMIIPTAQTSTPTPPTSYPAPSTSYPDPSYP